jgi:hypothetical protein
MTQARIVLFSLLGVALLACVAGFSILEYAESEALREHARWAMPRIVLPIIGGIAFIALWRTLCDRH